jgi:SAM-dependent methyltransferase
MGSVPTTYIELSSMLVPKGPKGRYQVKTQVGKDKGEQKTQLKDKSSNEELKKLFLRRPPQFMDTIGRWFGSPGKLVQPYVKKGHVVADLGCGWGAYTFAMLDIVGFEGKVYAVDLGENCIRAIQKRAKKLGYRNIEAHASSASDLSFIKDRSVDFVFANGLLCSMAKNRDDAVEEMKRILKTEGRAYVSLGFPPPLGFVDQQEWERIIQGFKLESGGNFQELWALVSLKRGAAKNI